MQPEDDYMEIGERGLIPSADGGFIEKATGRYIHPDDLVYDEDGDPIAYLEDEEDFSRELDD